jgi:D-alanyl-D-alanine carboxypeptidase/poly-gamma-glutamate capsule biosynthesis protein CapA/YwtB (metallophosphatase superfamily)
MIRKVVKGIFWSIIPIGLGILFTSLIWNGVEKIVTGENNPKERSTFISKIQNFKLANLKVEENVTASVFKFDNITYPPQPKYQISPEAKDLKIGAVSYVIGDVNTGEIIIEKNSEAVFPIASVTKLMTALVSLETHEQNEKTKVSSRAANTESSRGDLRTGENVLVSDLLYPLLLVSSNNAAEVLAEHSGRPSFMKSMNDFAKDIGMEKTNFEDPSGLSSKNTSTAKDLFKMSTYLENNHRTVFDITTLLEYTAMGKVWKNINRFSNNDNFIGGKTGYTSSAKRTGVGIFSVSFPGYEDRHIGIILLRTDDRTKDIYTILNYLRENVAYGYPEEIKSEEPEEIIFQGEVAGVKNDKTDFTQDQRNIVLVETCPKPESAFEDLFLFNATSENKLPENYVPDNLVSVKRKVDTKGREICLTESAGNALEEMYNAAQEDGLEIVTTSGFRSQETQEWLYEEWHRKNSAASGEEAIAKPGYSEHQLGTTIDFTSPAVGYDSAHRSFYLTDEYEWLDKNAHKYGFAMSYPPNKDTGYIFEPWHWRYVGLENAYHIKLANITVQEFLDPESFKEKIKNIEKGEVSISFLGDIMMDRGVKTSVYKNYGGDFNSLFKNLGELKEDDITFANLEGPVSDVGKNVGSKYSFRMEEKTLDALKNASFEIVSFANNHVGDWSVAAFDDTLGGLNRVGIKYTGAGKNLADASEVRVMEENGVKVGFLAFTDVGPNWMAAGESKSGILLASDPKRLEYIKTAKEKVDVLVVSYHWGDEYVPFNARQKSLAESSIDAGADIIAGHHPHVRQDTVTYKDGLIMYSLGNAIFDQYFSEETMKGGLVNIKVTKEGIKDFEEKVFTLDKTYVPGVPEMNI